MHEAKIEDTQTGRRAAGDGWFILNLAEMGWTTVPGGGTWSMFEAPSAPSPMRAWDYLHCPPGTEHITIGAGDGPCAILMVGTRTPGHAIHYPVQPAAAAHGASVTTATDSAKEAYANRPPFSSVRSPWPLESA